MRVSLALLTATSAVSLSGCAYGLYDDGYGYGGYGPYGGSSVSIGVGYGGGYGGYGYGYPYGGHGGYGGYGGYYGGYDPFGWYGDYYYPGTGIYVYDRQRNRHTWSDQQRRYWQDRTNRWRTTRETTTSGSTGENWSGWDRTRDRNWRDGRQRIDSGSRDRRDWNRPRTQNQSSGTAQSDRPRWSGSDRGQRHSREQANERPD